MKFAFTNIDVQKITFQKVSRSYERKIALLATVLIWVGLTYFGYALAKVYGDVPFIQAIAVLLVISMVLQLALTGKLWALQLVLALFNITPIGVLFRRDKEILSAAKKELLKIAQQIEFQGYFVYGRINPEIRSGESQVVIANQKSGNLAQWARNTRNLKKLANLVYQMYLAEQFIIKDANTLVKG